MDQYLKEKNVPTAPTGSRKSRILVAPLDWGLGHATRCIPLIHELLKQGADVWLAGEAAQEVILKNEFPHLPFLNLAGYRVQYARSALGLVMKMILQSAKMQKAIQQENAWLKNKVEEHLFDAVISDNRYGLYHKKIPSIIITHQLTIKSPMGRWTENILQNRNYKYINRFGACWVPDVPGIDNLAGELSCPKKKPGIPLHYIGVLSRFHDKKIPEQKDHLLVILSGPEPQRSILEEKIIREIGHYGKTATVIRGLPASSSLVPSTHMIRFYNHLPTEELNKEIQQAEYVISRSGYSTVMDIVKLQKKSILIPTPGQTEQEYLGYYLSKKQIACCVLQKEFTLVNALQKAKQFTYNIPLFNSTNKVAAVVTDFLAGILKR